MNTQYAIVKKEEFQAAQFPALFAGNWQTVRRSDGEYLCIHAFSKYIEPEKFLHVFGSEEELEAWRSEAIDTAIEKVEYDWNTDTARITIRHGSVHEFQLDHHADWTPADCEEAVRELGL